MKAKKEAIIVIHVGILPTLQRMVRLSRITERAPLDDVDITGPTLRTVIETWLHDQGLWEGTDERGIIELAQRINAFLAINHNIG